MIKAVHAVLYTKDADAVRAFFRDVLGFPSVDAVHGVEFTQPVKDAGFGMLTSMRIPGGNELYLYQPKHASPFHQKAGAKE